MIFINSNVNFNILYLNKFMREFYQIIFVHRNLLITFLTKHQLFINNIYLQIIFINTRAKGKHKICKNKYYQ